jgi:outer membrane autotransporter protein
MRHTETVRLTGKAVTAAVAAALLAMASAAGADTLTPSRISSTLDNSAADVTVTYTDDTADADIIYAPVEPGSADALTVNVNSLTVVNQTTAGTVQIQTGTETVSDGQGGTTEQPVYTTYDKNGGGIATNPAFPGTNITLNTAKDLSVTARTTAIEATGGSSITGTIGGNFTVSSQDVGISAAETTSGDGSTQAVNLTLAGGTAQIEAVNDAIQVSGVNSSLLIGQTGEISVTSESGYAVNVDSGTINLLGTGSRNGVRSGSISIESKADKSAIHLTGAAEGHDSWIDSGSVTVKTLSGTSAIDGSIENGSLALSASDSAGTGLQVINQSDTAATISLLNENLESNGHTLSLISSGPLIVRNDGTGHSIDSKHSIIVVNGYSTSTSVQVSGDISVDGGSVQIVPTVDGFVKADKIDVTGNGDFEISSTNGGTLTSLSGGKTLLTVDGERSMAGIYSLNNALQKMDIDLKNGGFATIYVTGNSVREGDVNATGQDPGAEAVSDDIQSRSAALLEIADDAKVTGNLTASDQGGIIAMMSGNSVMSGVITSEGASSAGVASLIQVTAMGNAAIDGDVIAKDQGAAEVTLMQSGNKLNGNLTSESSGTITLQSAGTWTGSSSVSGGTTDVTLTDAAAVWNVTGNSELTNFTQGAGTVNFPAAASGFTGTTVTVDGNYSSDGGAINMSTVLQGDTSPHDELDIKGDATGTATITFTKADGTGSKTIEGIKVVQVDGTSDAVFTKPDSNRLTAGAYIYDLKKVGKDWYLTSQRDPDAPLPVVPDTPDTPDTPEQPDILPPTDPTDPTAHIVKPELGSYAANMLAANTLFTMSLNDRLGETRYSDALKNQKHSGNIWIRTAGGKTHSKMFDDQLTNRGDWGLVQVGGDVVTWAGSGDHRFHAGLMMGYAHQSEKTRSSEVGVTSKGKVSGYSAGLYATYMNAAPVGTGPYVDTWLLWQKFKNKVDPSNSVEESYDSKGWTGSIEAGYTFGLKDWVSADGTVNATRLQLQAQVIRMGVRADQHVDAENFTVAGTGAGNVRTRVGATVYHLFTNEKTGRAIKPFIGLNWYHDTKNFGVVYDGVKDRIEGNRNFGEVKLGVEGKVTKHVNLWGAAAYQQGSHSFRNLGAFIGARVLF